MHRLKKRLLWQETEALRREGCSRYNKCLGIAAVANMPSFSCAGCDLYDPVVVKVDRCNPGRMDLYPKVEDRMNVKAFGNDILAKMRANGIPTKGPGLGNADWREKEKAS